MISTNQYQRIRRGLLFGLLAGLILTVGGCTRDTDNNLPQAQNINELVVANDQLTLLEAAITRAGLSTSLTQGGSFTVFAPTDAAFRASGYADVAAVNAIPVGQLQQILQYHVLRTSVPSSAITVGQSSQPTSLSAASATDNLIYINKTSTGGLSINGARVIGTEAIASNGIVYAIDQLLIPPVGNVLQVALADTSLRLLVAAAQRGGPAVTTALSGPVPLTVFAPTNSAFRAAGFLDTTAINRAQVSALTGILTNHVVTNPGRAFSPTLANGPITTFGGGSVTATVGTNNGVTLLSRGNGTAVSNVLSNTVVNGTLIRNRDINATNGVIHKIDRILLP